VGLHRGTVGSVTGDDDPARQPVLHGGNRRQQQIV
jgi:hypothetical protein